MGKIRVVRAMTNSMEDVVLHGMRQDPGFGGDRTLPANAHKDRDREIDPVVEFDQALDSSRSRGFGRYEI
jgi:hypothetical protein